MVCTQFGADMEFRAFPDAFSRIWLRKHRSPINVQNWCLGPPFLKVFGALALSLQNLGLEFRMLVLYYSFARVASYPMAPTL